MKIAMMEYDFCIRGTSQCIYQYAIGCKYILNHEIVIVTNKTDYDEEVMKRYTNHFPVDIVDLKLLDRYLYENKFDAIYVIHAGYERLRVVSIPLLVHCVYTIAFPHGHVYAAVSDAVKGDNKNIHVVRHAIDDIFYDRIVNKTSMRKELGIPNDHIVFGRHGGTDTFDVDFTFNAIIDTLNEKENVHFVFMIRPFVIPLDFSHPRIHILPKTNDTNIKLDFIDMCDAMIHASSIGESFGLSILEFMIRQKPIITYNNTLGFRQHLKHLGDLAHIYNNQDELKHILLSFNPTSVIYPNIEEFRLKNIIQEFDQIFLSKIN
jgi:glycosyltransferase involved in cell wall biosynthesis